MFVFHHSGERTCFQVGYFVYGIATSHKHDSGRFNPTGKINFMY